MAEDPCSVIIAHIRATFDASGSGIASRRDLQPVFQQILSLNDHQMEDMIRRFHTGIDGIEYEKMLLWIFGKAPKEEMPSEDKMWKEASDEQRRDVRAAGLAWLRDLSGNIPEMVRRVLVSHRGFHCSNDRSLRPLENSRPAYEIAWSSGITTCECDIQVTRDGHLVLNHDDDTMRLALLSVREGATIPDLTLRELMSMPLKNHGRVPLLREVLDSAVVLGSAQLVIEVKSGGGDIAAVLVEFLKANPTYVNHIPVIMSFDPDVNFKIAKMWPAELTRPKLMQLTIKKSAYNPKAPRFEQVIDFGKGDVRQDVEKLLVRDDVRLDGVYVEWYEVMLGRSREWLQKLCEMCVVGMWQNKGEPDCMGVCVELAKCGVCYVNSDFPRGFLREYNGHVQPEDRDANSLFASIIADPRGGCGGVWKERPSREQILQQLQSQEFDMLVIGGGATGVGTALEAVRQGYSVALVERGDFACGTSSKSSNMIHGGIRYLQAFVKDPENAAEQIEVVRKGLAEQSYMYNCAPYNVRPCPFMVACYAEDNQDTYGQLLKKYDELGSEDPFPESHWNSKKETLFQFPQLRQDGLCGSYVYYDGQQDDARMATLIALTAIEGGASVANYVEVQSLVKEGGITKGAVVKDVDGEGGRTFTVRAKVVVNATGPFTDAMLKMDQGPEVPQMIKPAAGTHVVLPDHFSPDRTGLAILETSDGRAMFYLPWMGQTIVGTTDRLSEILPQLAPPRDDITWIIQEVNRYLDPHQTPATGKDVLAAWTGIRPLANGLQSATGTKETEAKAGDTKSVPREHAVIVSESKLVTITGGKWTSYRHMAEDTLREAVKIGSLKAPKREYRSDGPTFEQGFVGTKAGPNVDYQKLELACTAPFHSDVVELRKKWGFPREIAENLIACYGTHAIEVAVIARKGEKQGLAQRLAEGYPWIMAQVVYGVRREYARGVTDVLSRRTRLAQVDVLAAYDAIPRIVDVMAEELQWSAARVRAEVHEGNSFLKSCGLDFVKHERLSL